MLDRNAARTGTAGRLNRALIATEHVYIYMYILTAVVAEATLYYTYNYIGMYMYILYTTTPEAAPVDQLGICSSIKAFGP